MGSSVFLNPSVTADNPFDQNLNTDDAVTFSAVAIESDASSGLLSLSSSLTPAGDVSPAPVYLIDSHLTLTPSAHQTADNIVGAYQAVVTLEGTHDISHPIAGMVVTLENNSSGDILYALDAGYGSNVYNNGGSAVTAIYNGPYGYAENNDGHVTDYYFAVSDVRNSDAIDTVYHYYANLDLGVGATVTTAYAFYSDQMVGVTNGYHLWTNDQGVFRIKADNTFDSVYQAIPALYNPQFTKYTPGAANHERIVMGQWNGNVAEIGTEKGGTGTLRAVKVLGASVELPAITTATGIKTTTTTANTVLFQAYDVNGTTYRTFATLTSGDVPDFTVAVPSGGTLTVQASTYKSSDGSSGVTAGPFTTITSITVKNGLVTALSGS